MIASEQIVVESGYEAGRVISRPDLCSLMKDRYSDLRRPDVSESEVVYYAVNVGLAVEFDGKLFTRMEVGRG